MAAEEKIALPSRRRFLKRTALGCVAGLGVYAVGIEPRWLEVTHHEIQIPGLDKRLDGKVAVHLSDTHIGTRVGDSYLERQLTWVQTLEPDFVFFTGDFLDLGSDWHIEKGDKFLRLFPKGKIGTACVLGNHDYMDGQDGLISGDKTQKLLDCFADHDVKVLMDEAIDCQGLSIVGLRDYWFGGFSVERAKGVVSSVAGTPSIALSHNPDTVDLPIWDGFESWVLSGHTHGGQCSFPLIGTPILPVVNKNYVAGKYDITGGHRMFITRGIGHTHRLRFLARPEISVLTLRS